MKEEPWGGRSPRELTKAFRRRRLPGNGASSTVVSECSSQNSASSEQLEAFPSEEVCHADHKTVEDSAGADPAGSEED